MKRSLLTLGLTAFALGASAQTVYFEEDFEANGISNWTNVDADGDGNLWEDANLSGGGKAALSRSWQNNVAFDPDNWLISSAIDLTSASGNVFFTMDALNADGSYLDKITVYAATGSTAADLAAGTVLYTGTPSASAWEKISFDMSSFIGQTVYLGIRHHDSYDKFIVLVDNLKIEQIASDDIVLTSVSLPDFASGASAPIEGVVTNNGANTITSFDLSYDDGSGPVTATITANIPYGSTYNFTHPTNFPLSGNGPYTLDVCATVAGDADNTNDCATGVIGEIVNTSFDKYVMVEEKTGTWCQFCPSGTAAMDNVGNVEDKFIGIAIHNQDPMAIASYDSQSSALPDFGGYPYAAADRAVGAHAANMQASFNARKNLVAPVSVNITSADLVGNTLTVTVETTSGANFDGTNFNLGVVLVQDNVRGSGTGWTQTNAFAGGSNPVPHTTPEGDQYNWQNLPQQVDVSTVFGGYDHVAEAIANDQWNGIDGSVPAGQINNGDVFSHTFTFNYNHAEWFPGNMHAVAYFVNTTTNEIYNAYETSITGATSVEDAVVNN
ncbi:choice-of-anchor J domain-containing protein, partial [Lishizhenia sp.]|uniref:choice-of-anchor J domain-containing protein n=1 Tax=Lishizhenia sp. TaxID=2497594 RepID=UPI00299EF34E